MIQAQSHGRGHVIVDWLTQDGVVNYREKAANIRDVLTGRSETAAMVMVCNPASWENISLADHLI